MKKILVLAFVVLTAINLFAQEPIKDNVSGSPYLMIIKDAPTKADIELTKTNVDVNISGIIADVTVKQYYKSTSDQVLEAVYVFPASVHAAVYSLKMKIGSREVVAVIKEKEQARKDYEQAKSEGKRASLLEQDRPNLFQMNLANIAPGDLIEIEMKYTEMLVPDDKIYTFTFPTIAAPRYGGGIKTSDVNEKENGNTQDKRFMTNMAFDINFNLISPVPIDGIECVTHEVNYSGETANHSHITLKDSEKKGVTKDFIVKYKLAGDLINSGLLLSKGEGKDAENFFLLTVQPPKRIDPAYIPPREYIFVLDVSGSMNGFPSVIAKKTILNLIDKLKPEDKFDLVLFASGFDVFSENLVNANRDNLEKAFKFMSESHQGGGTELIPALQKALTMPKDSKASRSIVIITDGLIDFEAKAFELIRNNLNQANLFAFGIGTSMNRLTIEGMARAGNGIGFETNRLEDAEYQSERFIKYISTPILADIKVTYNGFSVSDVEPTSVPDLFPDRPIVIYGKWDGNLQGGIKIEAINGQDKIFVDLPVTKFGEMIQGDALKQLWARKQIELLSDYQSFGERDKYKKEITDLGLKYNLMTAYTSFIAVDNEVVPTIDKESQNGNVPLGMNLKLQGGPAMREFGSVEEVARASSVGGSGVDAGGFSSHIDYLQVNNADKSSSSNKFVPVEGMPKVNDYSTLSKSVVYPDILKRASIEGKVIVAVWIDSTGKPTKTKIIDSPNASLNQAAIDAVMSYKAYSPATQNKKPIGCWLQIPINFGVDKITIPIEPSKTSIQYDEKELQKNIKYTKEAMNEAIEGSISMRATINANGKTSKIEPSISSDKLLSEIAENAIKATKFIPATQDGKNISSTIDIYLNIELPNTGFKMKFNGKSYDLTKGPNNSIKYWFANINSSMGEKVKFLDKVKFEYVIYDEKQKLIKKDTLTVTTGIGEAATPIDEALRDMQAGGEKLLLFEKHFLNTGLYPKSDGITNTRKIFVKIKVLGINPK